MPSNGFISRARQVVLDNLLNPQFGVSALARELGISRSELYRRVKEAEQKSASQFIREIRLDRALELLNSDQYSITEIAYMVGFNSPTYFSTCFKEYFGYSPSTADQNGHNNSITEEASRPAKWKVPLILGAVAIIIAVFGISSMTKSGRTEEEKSLAVLKFDYLGVDSAQTNRARALADEVLNSLSNRSGLRVVAASSSFNVDKSEACSKIGKSLGVDYLVDGSLTILGDQLKATVKLIDGREGHQLWARSFESAPQAFQELPGAISKEVAAQIQHSMLPEAQRSSSLQATELYLRARKMGDQRYKDSISQAIRLLDQAVDLDPNFAEAYGELSFLYGQLHFYGSVSLEERDKLMEEHLKKALEISPESPEVLFAKADFMFKTGQFVRDSSTIVSGFKLLHQANPEVARICYRLFQVYRAMGQYDTSHEYLEKAVQLEPKNSFYLTILARDLFWKRGQKERAFGIIQEVTSQDRYHHSSICFKTAMLVDQAQYGYLPAIKKIQRALEEEPYSDWYLFWAYQLFLDLDLIPLATKNIRLYEVKFPENPIYTYGSLIKLLIAERRFQDAIDLTQIWVSDNRLDPQLVAANLSRLYYLQGNHHESLELLQAEFPELLQQIRDGSLEPVGLEFEELEAVRTYVEVNQSMGKEVEVTNHKEFLCAYYTENGDATNYGNKLNPLDCLYLQGDLKGFLQALEDTFFRKGEPFRIYTNLKTLRYREFVEYPEYQQLFRKIEAEIHRQRAEVIAYLKEEGDWDSALDAALQ
ncbi:MAG: helix-turn-helix domain-containing protein [Eudoraea sp.]|nr:helix-turn-helix domain-containing protein [Eudoraea sp.]